jgi:uncharacterized protein (TIGR03790 family)
MKTYLSILLTAALMITATAYAQTNDYSDVLVIINTNSQISNDIGSYFAQKRNIPAVNIARISVPVTEEIDSTQFENLRSQVESYLVSNNLVNSINYIVTTKGMPLKVKHSDSYANASVENELSLILGPYASGIGQCGRIYSPYFGKTENFTHAKFGIYLVTRLDGYTFADVQGLIDRADSTLPSIPSNAQFVLDEDPAWNTAVPYLNTNMQGAASQLQLRNISVTLDSTTTYLTHQTNILGYVSWGSNDHYEANYTDNAKPYNSFLPGAIAETYVSTSGRSFSSPPVYGQSLIADLIAEGVTGVKGYVYEPYSSAMANVQTLFPMYADGFTLAECFYSASSYLSWMDVVIGDPKYRLVSNPSGSKSIVKDLRGTSKTSTSNGASDVSVLWSTLTEYKNSGFEVERKDPVQGQKSASWKSLGFVSGSGTSYTQKDYSFMDTKLKPNTYYYRLKQVDESGAVTYTDSIEVSIGNASALPVQMTSFTATALNHSAELIWATATEAQNAGFEIERKTVGQAFLPVSQARMSDLPWTKIAFVSGSGTTNSPRNYSYTDIGLAPGSYAYRIKQINSDGTFEYHDAAEVVIGSVPKVLALSPNYPNPFNPSTTIEFTVPENRQVTLKIYNVIGQEVATLFNGIAEGGQIQKVKFDASSLPSGLYISRLQYGNQSVTQKMMLEK